MAQGSEQISLEVQQSLKDSPYACSSLQSLSGGTANFVYRGTLMEPLEDGTKTIIIKHSEPYVAQNPAFKLTTDRCDFERTILDAVSKSLPRATHANLTIQTPHVYPFTSNTLPNTQLHSDLPLAIDLKTYLLTHPINHSEAQQLGHALGLWTKRFHAWAAAPEQSELRAAMKGNTAMRELKFQINYLTLVATVDNFPEILEQSRELFTEIREAVRKEMDSKDGEGEAVLIHGDFWTGNVLLANKPFPANSQPLNLFITDWELSHLPSTSHTLSYSLDLGQMFAELYELKHFKNIEAGMWIVEAFMQEYGGVSQYLAFRTAVHVGVHLICWGTRVAGWGSKEQVEDVARKGRDLVEAGWKKEKAKLEEIGWGCLFN